MIGLLLVPVLLSATALAQVAPEMPALDAAGPAPAVDAVGLSLVPPVAVDEALVARVDVGVARDLLRWQPETGEALAAVGTAWRMDLAAAGGFGPLRIGASMPMFLTGTGDLAARGAAVAGDLRLDGRLDALGAAGVGGPVGVGLVAGVALPLGASAHGLGETGPAGDVGVLVDAGAGPLWLGARGTVLVREAAASHGLTLDEALGLAGGLSVEVIDATWIGGEVATETPLVSPFASGPATAAELRGVLTRGVGGVRVQALGGAGVGQGVGAPAWRAGIGLTYGQPVEALAPPALPGPGERNGEGASDE